MLINSKILQGEIRYQRELVDTTARDLLSQIFVTEPNLRITLDGIKSHKFFHSPEGETKFWKQVATK